MAESFGARMRERREQQQISLIAISEQTKIKLSLLDALEHDDVSQWPTGIFRRAFIRAYARAVDLDADIIVREFLERHPDPGGDRRPRACARTRWRSRQPPSRSADAPSVSRPVRHRHRYPPVDRFRRKKPAGRRSRGTQGRDRSSSGAATRDRQGRDPCGREARGHLRRARPGRRRTGRDADAAARRRPARRRRPRCLGVGRQGVGARADARTRLLGPGARPAADRAERRRQRDRGRIPLGADLHRQEQRGRQRRASSSR